MIDFSFTGELDKLRRTMGFSFVDFPRFNRHYLLFALLLLLASCSKNDAPVEGFWTGTLTKEGSIQHHPSTIRLQGESSCAVLRHRGADLTIELEGTYSKGSGVDLFLGEKKVSIPTDHGRFRYRLTQNAQELGPNPYIRLKFSQPGIVLEKFQTQENKHFPKTIFFALDGATWRIMSKLIQENRLPHFQELMKRGSYGELNSIEPTLSPVVWTSIATGKSPEQHGIHHFLDENDIPVHSGQVLVPRAWNIFSQKTPLTVGVLGWFVTWPVEPVNGFMISDRAFDADLDDAGNQLSFNPHELRPFYQSVLEERRSHYISESKRFTSLPLNPQFQQLDPHSQSYRFHRILDRRLFPVYFRDSSYIQAGLELYRTLQPDVFFLYLRGNDFTQHTYWFYNFPEDSIDPINKEELKYFRDIIKNYYVYLDEIIGKFMEIAPKDTTFIIASDHGFKTVYKGKPGQERRIAYHEREGIYIFSGPDFKKDFRKDGLSIYDICPLLLYRYGLPVAKDMKGHVPTELWRGLFSPRDPIKIATYGTNPNSRHQSLQSSADQETIEQLKSLGYIGGD